MRSVVAIFASLLMVACVGNGTRSVELARFDLGPPSAAVSRGTLAAVEVAAPSWLAGSNMQYRLLYAEPTRRFDYAESRWAAPPAELLRQALERRFAADGAGRCRLHVEIDEWVQVFDSAQSSRLVLAGRAVLLGSPEVLARRSFSLSTAAPSADARGGVGASTAAVNALGDELAAWLASVGRCG